MVNNQIASTLKTNCGTAYVVEGKLESPDGRNPGVRSVWFVDTGSQIPRLVTAYPINGVMMFNEYERIILTENLPEHGLEIGDAGTIVEVLGSGKAFLVEFFTLDGNTIAVASVLASQARAATHRDITHARSAQSAV